MPPKRGLPASARLPIDQPLPVAPSRADELVALQQPLAAPPAPPPLTAPGPAPVAPALAAPAAAYWTPALIWVQEHGFTHPSWGGWLQLPREFDAILALERKPVAQIVLEVMRRTVGYVDPSGAVDAQGRPARVEWAPLTHQHLTAICGGSPSNAQAGLKIALAKRYIERRRAQDRPHGPYEYRIRWSTPRDGTT